jgi:hypothetical protein
MSHQFSPLRLDVGQPRGRANPGEAEDFGISHRHIRKRIPDRASKVCNLTAQLLVSRKWKKQWTRSRSLFPRRVAAIPPVNGLRPISR